MTAIRHLLDADSIIDVLKGISATIAVLEQLASQGSTLCINDVGMAEVYSGLRPQDEATAEQFLSTLEYLQTSADAARQAGAWRYAFARRGRPLALTDCLIAATAVEHQATLVTRNIKDFPMSEVQLLAVPRPNR